MYFQRDYIRDSATLVRNDTYRLDLPKTGLLGSLLIGVTGVLQSAAFAGGGSWRIVDYIDKIEIVANGSSVIKSISGQCLQALMFWDQGVFSLDKIESYGAAYQRAFFLLNFGRKLFDSDMYLDLSKFSSVELRVTFSGTSTYFSADPSINIMAYYLRGQGIPSPKGFLRTEEWRKWTTVSDAWTYLDLPEEYPIRRIMLQAVPPLDSNNLATAKLYNIAYEVQLTLQTGGNTVFNGKVQDLMRDNVLDQGAYALSGYNWYGNVDKGFWNGLGYVHAMGTAAMSQTGAAATTIPTIKAANGDDPTTSYESAQADVYYSNIALGLCPHNTLMFRFDQNPDPRTWLDPAAERVVNLNIHTRSGADYADGTIRVVLDRLVEY